MEKTLERIQKTIDVCRKTHPSVGIFIVTIDEMCYVIGDDARKIYQVLGVELLSYNDIDYIKLSFYSLDIFIPKLIHAGFKIGISRVMY